MRQLSKFTTSEEMGEWYNNKYKEMGGAWYTPAEACNEWLDKIFKYHKDEKWPTLLDIGCGGGHFLEQAEKRCICTGIELSQTGIDEALGRIQSNYTKIIKEDIEGTELVDREFDIIVSIGTLEHVINIPKALKEINRLLADDGVFYLYAPNEEWDYTDQPQERTMNKEEWLELLMDFKLINFEKDGKNNIYILKKK